MTAAIWMTSHDWSAVVSWIDGGIAVGILVVSIAGVWDLARGRKKVP